MSSKKGKESKGKVKDKGKRKTPINEFFESQKMRTVEEGGGGGAGGDDLEDIQDSGILGMFDSFNSLVDSNNRGIGTSSSSSSSNMGIAGVDNNLSFGVNRVRGDGGIPSNFMPAVINNQLDLGTIGGSDNIPEDERNIHNILDDIISDDPVGEGFEENELSNSVMNAWRRANPQFDDSQSRMTNLTSMGGIRGGMAQFTSGERGSGAPFAFQRMDKENTRRITNLVSLGEQAEQEGETFESLIGRTRALKEFVGLLDIDEYDTDLNPLALRSLREKDFQVQKIPKTAEASGTPFRRKVVELPGFGSVEVDKKGKKKNDSIDTVRISVASFLQERNLFNTAF